MSLTTREIKQRHFNKTYGNANLIDCKCGCGQKLKDKDRYGRDKSFINGHNGRKYSDPKEYKRVWRKKNPDKMRVAKNNRRKKRKILLIDYRGGKCVGCGVLHDGVNTPIFDFHHLSNKSFNISAELSNMNIDFLKKEVDKCEVLCSNCHRMKHKQY